ncbi:hypothetical protein GUJ93_ZPchr0007g4376 [Zizania palustris]|uniref:Bifunctional inhibitor/plant lipid transfer protein/seed storage helical domain-containing protein n=1 Tax=Zizania palustris TaxID=103762 RepID=A0A8J5W6H3_ZIZPA|nr:hypothetical protein GUJ93_ZPchr0007g4376 [Zizania palustris]
MAPSSESIVVVVFALFAVASLQPSAAVRNAQVFKLTAENQEAQEEKATTGSGIPQFPMAQLPPLPPLPQFLIPQLPSLPSFPQFVIPQLPPLLQLPQFVIPQLPLLPPLPQFQIPLMENYLGSLGTPPQQQVPSSPNTPAVPLPKVCLPSLMQLMPCMEYLTQSSVAAPPSTCCSGFKSLVDKAPICLCHGINGNINKFTPAPIDFARMMSLPATCNVTLPLQTLAQCSTGPVPPLIPAAAPSPGPSA